ncbi:hypothetical protein [Jongsikchunia kroppenstedtii]|uniref:hypothetical protein n=1 Tax=Jongsikchunia kroppenstedtii TaxID=1121721 RepID=UPI000374AEFC|nr:hypothetical protein [Jongsikchunia kroppenstedtii]
MNAGQLVDRVLIGLLTVVGFGLGIVSVMFLDCYVGSAAIPFGAIIAAVGNCTLRLMAGWHTESARGRFLPLVGWAVPVAIAVLWGGPGKDSMFVQDWRVILLLVLGIGGAMIVGWNGHRRT